MARLFANLGIPVIDTDVIARDLVKPGTPALNEIRERFGDAVLDASGSLNRSAMRKIIFAKDDARLDLEAILHPRIGAEVFRQSEVAGGPYQIVVIPLLVNSSLRPYLHRVVVVDCSEEEQLRRLLLRDEETEEQALRILAAQSSRQDRLAIADDVIQNDVGMQALDDKIRGLDQLYRRLAAPQYRREQSPETQ